MKYPFNLKMSLSLIFLLVIGMSYAQVGIGTTTPSDGALLDLNSTNKGLLIPRVNIADLSTIAPVTPGTASGTDGLLVWNTNGTTGVGFHYWDGSDWIPIVSGTPSDDWTVLGNNLTVAEAGTPTTDGTHFIGTTNSRNLNFRTNGVFRGRLSNLGEFFIGTQSTILAGDLMNAVGNATFPWALNGYSNQNGAGVYGSVTTDGVTGTGGTTIYAGVQGEYQGTNALGPGVRGLTFTTTGGSDFLGTTVAGVSGSLATGNLQRSFGVMGATGDNFTIRVGGVLGTDLFASGALGYYASNYISYGVYAFGNGRVNGIAGGRLTNQVQSTHVGMGIHGGFMGGWIKGQEYGAIFSGERFGSYTLGKSITNDAFMVLDETKDGEIQATYASTSLSIDVQSKGIGQLINGHSRIDFEKGFSEIIDEQKPIIVTVTPYGESNGVHIVSVDKNGFTIKENNSGLSNVQFNWIAIAEKSNKGTSISQELLSKEFDHNLSTFMHDDDQDGGSAIWYENGEIKFGKQAPRNTLKERNFKSQPSVVRPKEDNGARKALSDRQEADNKSRTEKMPKLISDKKKS